VIGYGMGTIVALVLLLVVYAVLGFKKPGIALVTSLVLCSLLIPAGRLTERNEVMFFGPLIFLTTLAAVVMSRREGDLEEWPQKWAKLMLIGLVFLLLFATTAVAFGTLGIVISGFFALFIVLVISCALTSNKVIAAHVISTIGSSMRQNLPLPMALESAASGGSDKQAQTLQEINKWLVQGYSLSESIKRGFGKCPSDVVAMIAAAERVNQLPVAIEAIEEDMAAELEEGRKINPVDLLVYPVTLMVAMFIIVLALVKQVLPKLQQVLAEMLEEPEFPWPTRILFELVHYITYEAGPVFWGIIGFIIFVVVPLGIRSKFRPRQPEELYLVSRIGDFIKWHLSIPRWFAKNYALVQVVELLRLSLKAGCPVNEAIANTLTLDVNNCFKKQLQRWLEKVEAGENIAGAAREAKLGAPLAWAFDEKVNQGNTLGILEMLESYYRSNYSYRVNLARFILEPCMVIMIGLIVGFVVLAIFLPLVKMVSYASALVTP
jgi:type II secretory pathway component PulF